MDKGIRLMLLKSIRVASCAYFVVHLAAVAQTTTADGDWPSYGGDLRSGKYSPLDQITGDNFDDLVVAWRWKSVDGFLCMDTPSGLWCGSAYDLFDAVLEEDSQRWSRGRAPRIYNFKATPLMVGGVLYVSTPLYQAAAIDATIGAALRRDQTVLPGTCRRHGRIR